MKKTVLITGATSGIGLAVVYKFIEAGYQVLATARDKEKAQAVLNETLDQNPKAQIHFFYADLANLDEVRKLADEVKNFLTKKNQKLDVLINNAGGVKGHYTETKDSYEYQFALNHLSGFLLSYLLVPVLKDGQIQFTGSKSHYRAKIYWPDVMLKKRYLIFVAYKQSKLANLITAMHLNEKLKKFNIKAYTVDPGLVDTSIGAKGTGWIARTYWNFHKRKGTPASIPAKTYLYLAKSRPVEGVYFKDSQVLKYNPIADLEVQSNQLFTLSEKLCQISYDDL